MYILISVSDHFTAKLSVRTNNGPDLVTTNFTFFDCSTHLSCTRCVSSQFPCDWCVEAHRCTHDTAENCRNDILVTGVSVSSAPLCLSLWIASRRDFTHITLIQFDIWIFIENRTKLSIWSWFLSNNQRHRWCQWDFGSVRFEEKHQGESAHHWSIHCANSIRLPIQHRRTCYQCECTTARRHHLLRCHGICVHLKIAKFDRCVCRYMGRFEAIG